MTRSRVTKDGGLLVVKDIVDIAKVLKESEQTLGVCLQQTLDVLLDHEERLEKVEADFAILCRILGVEDLEE
jgi:sulfite reductase beta subunit-like hemoprotein